MQLAGCYCSCPLLACLSGCYLWLCHCSWWSLAARWLRCAGYVHAIEVFHVNARQALHKGTLHFAKPMCILLNAAEQHQAGQVRIVVSFDLQVRLITSSAGLQAWLVAAKLGHLQA